MNTLMDIIYKNDSPNESIPTSLVDTSMQRITDESMLNGLIDICIFRSVVGESNQEIVSFRFISFRSCVRARGLVA